VASQGITLLLADRNSFILYNAILYILLEPFLIVKVVLVTQSSYFVIVMLRFLYQEYRPFWQIPYNLNVFCIYSFASPSMKIAMCLFCWRYLMLTVLASRRNKRKASGCHMALAIIGVFLVVSLVCIVLLINLQNYLFQLILAVVVSL